MKKWLLVAQLSALVSGVLVLIWWLWPSTVGPEQPPPVTSTGRLTTLAPAANAPAVVADAQHSVTSPAMTAEPVSMARQYQDMISYPPYAMPITAHNDYLLTPNRFETVTVPGDAGRSWSLSLSQYRYAYPQPVVATVRFQGDGPAPATVRYQLQRQDDLTVLQQGELSAGGLAGSGHYQLTLAGAKDWPAELRLTVEPHTDSSEGVGASFLYVQPVARVIGTGALQAADSDLVIPVTIEVYQAGLYRVQAILQRQLTDGSNELKPLAFLQQEAMLRAGQQQLLLKAHHSVLPDQPLELALSHIQLQRASMHPAEPTGFGVDQLEPLPLGAFTPTALSKTPYQPDAAEQARLKLLSGIQP
jgi:hypothetical protein